MENNTESISHTETLPIPSRSLVTDKDILIFAKQILLFLFIAFVLCGIGGLYFKAQSLFEIMKVEIPPLFTLIIGYYFGKDKK